MTQTLVIHVIRTNKIPFLQSSASWTLTLTTASHYALRSMAAVLASRLFAGPDALARDVLANPAADTACLHRPHARGQGLAAEDEMDLEHNKPFMPSRSSLASEGRPMAKSAFRRFQKFLVRKQFKMPVRNSQNCIAPAASAFSGLRCWEQTMESFRLQVWYSALRRHMELTAAFWLLGSPAWSLERCPWLRASMFLYTRRPTQKRPN